MVAQPFVDTLFTVLFSSPKGYVGLQGTTPKYAKLYYHFPGTGIDLYMGQSQALNYPEPTTN